jgi:tetratricopeptide (TPR) repeat protein
MLVMIVALATLGSGCQYARTVMAKDKVNQGAIKYNQGRNKEAQEFFKDATETDPAYTMAWLYYGATLVKDYKKELDEAKKKEGAQRALDVYKKALEISNGNCIVIDNALSYIATIYDDMNNVDDWRKTMEQRATNKCTKNEAKAQSFYAIGVKYWQCSYDQTTRYADKALLNKDPFHYRNMDYPAALADKQKAEACVASGLENFDKALQIDPEYEAAMFYKGMLYREREKMTKEDAKHKEFDQMAIKIAADATAIQKKKEAMAAQQKAQDQAAPKG